MPCAREHGGAEIDWAELRAQATRAAQNAYAPYSGLRVGAAGLASDGRIYVGCNVENACLGLTLCAECGLVSNLVARGAGALVAVSIVAADGRSVVPCGRCRQLLIEQASLGLVLDQGPGAPPRLLQDLLPEAWRSSGDMPTPGLSRAS
jgi:cytidine deaminase